MSVERIPASPKPHWVDVEGIDCDVQHRLDGRLRPRTRDLEQACQRWLAAHHNGIPDDAVQGTTADLVRQVEVHLRRVDEDRRAVRQELAAAIECVDTAYNALAQSFTQPLEQIRAALKDYGVERAAAERKRRLERSERARRAADRAAGRLAASPAADAIFAALAADMRAEQAATDASAPTSRLSRVEGDYGSAAAVRDTWRWRVVDRDAVPREYLQIDTVKLRRAMIGSIKDGAPTVSIAGVEFYRDTVLTVS